MEQKADWIGEKAWYIIKIRRTDEIRKVIKLQVKREMGVMRNKLFLATMAAALAIPAVVVPVQADEIKEAFQEFTDVTKSHSNYEIIMEMQKEGIINGYEDGTFRPKQAISRMHVASLLDRAITLEPIRDAIEFKDVPKTHAYYEIIQKIQRAGIVDGSDGNYNPNASLTRVQMAKILVNAFDLKVKAEYDFPDIPTNHWGKDYVRALYSNGITTGDNGYFNPNEPVSRAHYAVFLHRLLNIDEDFVAPPIPKPEPKPDKDCVEGVYGPGINSCPPDPNLIVKPIYVPSGAKLIEDTGYEQVYSYNKKLPSGGAIHKIIGSKSSISMVGTDNNGKSMLPSYLPERDVISYTVFGSEKPAVNTESLELLYEIGKDFAIGYGYGPPEPSYMIGVNIGWYGSTWMWEAYTDSKTLGEEIDKHNKNTSQKIILKKTKDGRVIDSYEGKKNNDKYEWKITSKDCKGGKCSKDVDAIKLDKDMEFVIKYEEK